jgi:hypothetical protein
VLSIRNQSIVSCVGCVDFSRFRVIFSYQRVDRLISVQEAIRGFLLLVNDIVQKYRINIRSFCGFSQKSLKHRRFESMDRQIVADSRPSFFGQLLPQAESRNEDAMLHILYALA